MRTGPQTAAGSSSVLQTDPGTMVSASQYVRDAVGTIHQQFTHMRTNIENLGHLMEPITAVGDRPVGTEKCLACQ